jgi:hypothetical protein
MKLEDALWSLRKRLDGKQRQQLRRFVNTKFPRFQRVAWRLMFGSNLAMLSMVNASDKNTNHRYIQHYTKHLSAYRKKPVNLLEIGIGGFDEEKGYSVPHLGGGSLRMWRTYFPKGRIYGIDIFDKTPHNERRIKTFRGSQADTDFLRTVVENTGSLDIIIDDGSHRCDHVIASFEFLFPRMKERGLYIIEDVQTSYLETFGGSEHDPDQPYTTMGYFKGLLHGLNYEERRSLTKKPTYFDENILGLSFYHNLIVIEKGPNTEGRAR